MNIDNSEFEIVELDIEESDRFEEDDVNYLRKEDEIIQALYVCSSKSFIKCIPVKDEIQLNEELKNDELVTSVNGETQFNCKRHPKRKAGFICVNKCCDYTLYCMSCRMKHNKECSRDLMYLNIDDISKKDYVDQIFNVKEFNYDDQIEKVQELIKKKKKNG